MYIKKSIIFVYFVTLFNKVTTIRFYHNLEKNLFMLISQNVLFLTVGNCLGETQCHFYWLILSAWYLQLTQLLAVDVEIELLSFGQQLIVDNTLTISLTAQQDFPGRQPWFGQRLLYVPLAFDYDHFCWIFLYMAYFSSVFIIHFKNGSIQTFWPRIPWWKFSP